MTHLKLKKYSSELYLKVTTDRTSQACIRYKVCSRRNTCGPYSLLTALELGYQFPPPNLPFAMGTVGAGQEETELLYSTQLWTLVGIL